MKTTRLKAMALSLTVAAMLLLPTTSTAQIDGFFKNYDNGDRDGGDTPTWNVENNGIGQSEAPLGSGLLILGVAGAGYAIAKRRKKQNKSLTLLIAAVMLLGFTQCKKNIVEPTVIDPTGGTKYYISVPVDDGSKVNVNPNTGLGYATVSFEEGDIIYVGYNNAYVGYITYNASESCFKGSITTTISGTQPLHLYMLGGKGFTPTIDGNTATVNISDQTSQYPVISYAPTNENFTENGTYTAKLLNKCSIMKFNVTSPSTAAVFITGMNNKVTVDFTSPSASGNGFSYSIADGGLIKMSALGEHDSETAVEKWAIVLPQEALTTPGEVYTEGGYTGTRPVLPTISSNQYLNSGVALYMNTRLGTPLTFEAKTANSTIEFVKEGSEDVAVTIQYSTDGSSWKDYTVGTTDAITLNNIGDKVMFRASGTNTTLASGTVNYHRFHVKSGDFYAYGNVMSMLYNDFSGKTSFPDGSTYTFCQLFNIKKGSEECHIYNHPTNEFVLPATTLSPYCYYLMFYDCTQMTVAPALPATTLAEGCYHSMFSYCTNLITAPALPVKNLAVNCYNSMFLGCEKLTAAPTLEASEMKNQCYEYMFAECTSLETAPALPATTLANSCYLGMFSGCTALETAPTLSAVTLEEYCYEAMFMDCTSLNSIICLATNISATNCTNNWVSNVAASGTFTKASTMSNWTTGVDGIPSNWSVQDASK